MDFPDPHQIDPDRKTLSIQGMGLHKCPGIGFVDEVRDLIEFP
jgi:cytochrome P450